MNYKFLHFMAAAVMMASVPQASRGAVLALYDFSGYTSTSAAPYAAGTVASNVVAGGFTPASGLGTNGNWNNTNNGIDTVEGNLTPSYSQKAVTSSIGIDQATAFSLNSYWSITVQAGDGFQLDLSSLSFDVKTLGTSGGSSNFYLSSSIGGFATPIGAVTTNYNSGSGFSTVNFDLTAETFQNLSGPIEFRVYLWWNSETGTSSGSSTKFDNVTLNGNLSAVPEPSTWALMGCGFAALAWLRRRQKM